MKFLTVTITYWDNRFHDATFYTVNEHGHKYYRHVNDNNAALKRLEKLRKMGGRYTMQLNQYDEGILYKRVEFYRK